MNVRIEPSWKEKLAKEFEKPYFKELTEFVREAYQTKTVYPKPKDIFKAFDLCPFDKIKVVIVGQDPYHGPKQATASVFPYKNLCHLLHHCKISSKRSMMTLALKYLKTAI